MVFNSAAFLSVFLPLSFGLYRLMPGEKARTVFLSCASVLFYAFGGLGQLPILLLSVVWCYFIGIGMQGKTARHAAPVSDRRRKVFCIVGVAGMLALLAVFKYADFALKSLGGIFSFDARSLELPLPLGISFFTFHAISYIIDTYRAPESRAESFGKLFVYLAFFPRLLAGPIVKYKDALTELSSHPVSPVQTTEGIRRFIRGMAKKLLLSEAVGVIVNTVWSLDISGISAPWAWLAAICYCLQLYYDFSGYSDMAIGLGMLFGFRFPENFDYPYISSTLGEFWRRWHMTLNRWFVDYLYIPLGGSRCSKARNVLNKMIVFFFTGLWHGAGWSFILWGLWHGVFVSAEGLCKGLLGRAREKLWSRAALHVYTLLVVILGFVMFRAPDVSAGFSMLGCLFSLRGYDPSYTAILEGLVTPMRAIAIVLGCCFAAPILPRVKELLPDRARETVLSAISLLLLALCVLALSGGGFSPFIYQQF